MVRRAAVVGGTAYAVGRHASNQRQEQAADAAYEQGLADAAAAPPPQVAPAEPDTVEQLRRLAELRDQGILTEEEFSAEKRKILGM
jgi:hypothetical protein